MLAPREVAFTLIGAIVCALLGWVAAAALHQTRIGGIVIGALVGVGVGVGVWRYLSQKARLRGLPVEPNTDALKPDGHVVGG